MRHRKKRYGLLPAVESFMVPGALQGHRGDVTLNFEPETCMDVLVVTARAGSDAVAGSRKLCWDDVWLCRQSKNSTSQGSSVQHPSQSPPGTCSTGTARSS